MTDEADMVTNARTTRQAGFTLIEVLLAVGITAFVMVTVGSTFQTSPASKTKQGMPRSEASRRKEPTGPAVFKSSSEPKARARPAMAGSLKSARTLGKLVRRTAAECRSIPKSQRRTTLRNRVLASRPAKLPLGEPGKHRFKSRRSGR